ncbi:MAG: hypothetical protein ACLRIP_16810 [Blautia massiliensis (ex Durand et al. 2017)]
MMQRYGYDPYLIDGPEKNIKITTPEDFYTYASYSLKQKKMSKYMGLNKDNKKLIKKNKLKEEMLDEKRDR